MGTGEEQPIEEVAVEAIEPLPHDDGGLAFLEAVQERGRELAGQGDDAPYFQAFYGSVGRLLAGGYEVGKVPFIDAL